MASKQTSIFGPFIVTALGGITLGLIVMYFGHYQGRISSYERYIAELQNKPTPEISFTFTVKEPSLAQKLINKDLGSGPEPPSQASETFEDNSVAESRPEGVARSTKQSNSAGTASSRPARGKKAQPNMSSDTAQARAPARGPAFPKTHQAKQQSDSYDSSEESYSKSSQQVPDIDDPELDDNPLIKAIREASRRQAQNPQDFEYDEDSPRPNPFETILNIRTD